MYNTFSQPHNQDVPLVVLPLLQLDTLSFFQKQFAFLNTDLQLACLFLEFHKVDLKKKLFLSGFQRTN
jgi:hypothetical protein